VNGCRIRGAGHNAVKRINFADQMPLPHPTNGWVAGHFANGFNFMGQQKRARATAGCRRRSLTAGMAPAHYHNIKGQISTRHVRPISALLADTEVPEDDIENFLNTHASCKPAKGEKRRAQGLCRQFRKTGFLSLGQQRRRFGSMLRDGAGGSVDCPARHPSGGVPLQQAGPLMCPAQYPRAPKPPWLEHLRLR
jgi:hypothetical protein